MSNDYIPQSDRIFLSWEKNLFACITANAHRWNLDPSSWSHIDPPMISAYEDALAKVRHPNSGAVDKLRKNGIRDILKKETRQFVNEYLRYNSRISNEDRINMGMPVRDLKPTPVHKPDTVPEAMVKLTLPGVIELHVVDSKSGRRAKPKGVHGYEIKWAVLEEPVTRLAQLTESSFSTRSTFRMTFSSEQRGKKLSFALRYENTRGEKGPWSKIMTAYIP
ncbi:MAG: hypothetical protein LBK58_12450 [Prevotellaceae bacterium]|jgi:hypothetical protein|nr:hypothetical protein [Prevotellaceae bacterium]